MDVSEVWKLSFWETSYFRYLDNIQVAAWNYRIFITKTFDGNTFKKMFSYLGHKEQKATVLVVSRLEVRFILSHPFSELAFYWMLMSDFSKEGASKIAPPKNWTFA